ncbi:hypothetical protein [Thioclava sp. GXIMD4215]|uniref:hypothetical protein n=1 Tax=Thioclava sp. GXIMD4215 TaxID=3131928 RepID=UPI00311ACCF4
MSDNANLLDMMKSGKLRRFERFFVAKSAVMGLAYDMQNPVPSVSDALETLPRLPDWVTSARDEVLEDVTFLSGTALATLDLVLLLATGLKSRDLRLQDSGVERACQRAILRAGDDASTCVLGSSALSPGRVLADGSSAAILASLTPNMSDSRPPHPLQSDRKGSTRSKCSGRWTGTVYDGTGADRLRNPEMTMAIPRLQATNRAQTVGHAC